MSHEEMTDEQAMKQLKIVIGALCAFSLVLAIGVAIVAG